MPFPGFMFGGGAAWTSLSLNPLADWLADTSYITTDVGGVAQWDDRSVYGQHLAQVTEAERPDFEATGWSGSQSSVLFPAGPNLSGPDGGTVVTAVSGDDVPFSILATLQLSSAADDRIIAAWDHTSGGNAHSMFLVDNTGTGRLRYSRQGDAGAAAIVTGPTNLGTGHIRVGLSFSGSAAALYVGGVVDTTGACNVTTTSFNRFRLCTGPGAADSFDGRIKHICIVGREVTAAEHQIYKNWSVASFGA
jgi:hypothetical protein